MNENFSCSSELLGVKRCLPSYQPHTELVRLRISCSDVCHFWCVLTVVDKADRGDGLKTGVHFSSFDLFKSIRQTIEEVLPLLVEAQPQIQLQFSLNCPTCRTKALLTRQLWAKIRLASK